MDPLTRSALLRQEADYVMHAIGLHDILAPYGPVAFIGSYFLDVMAYPDIDLLICNAKNAYCNPNSVSLELKVIATAPQS